MPKNLENDRNFRSVISQWKGSSIVRLCLYNKDIEVYDINKKKISLQSLKNRGTIKLLLWVNKLVINKDVWFIKLSCMIVDR